MLKIPRPGPDISFGIILDCLCSFQKMAVCFQKTLSHGRRDFGGKRVIRTQSNKKYGLTSQKQKL